MPHPKFKDFPKPVYNCHKKKPAEILATLAIEAASLMAENMGYKLHEFKGPFVMPDNTAVYYIRLKICASLIQL